MAGPIKTLKNEWPKFLVELMVLVLGITASFVLNEWRVAIGERQDERQTLEALRADLAADSSAVAFGIGRISAMIDAYTDLLEATGTGAIEEARVDEAMDLAISYWAFARTDNTYEAMKQTGTSQLIRNKELLAEVIQLYNLVYMRLAEWDEINRHFILERMVPYVDDEAPYVEQGSEGGIATGYMPIFLSLKDRDRFKNLIKTNRLFKQAQVTTYEGTLGYLRVVLEGLDEELAN